MCVVFIDVCVVWFGGEHWIDAFGEVGGVDVVLCQCLALCDVCIVCHTICVVWIVAIGIVW